jgi:zinc transporter 1/2/3
MMSLFSLFLVEILAMRYASFKVCITTTGTVKKESEDFLPSQNSEDTLPRNFENELVREMVKTAPPLDADLEKSTADVAAGEAETQYAAQMTSLFILEFGVIFHSIFIGLTLAVSGSEFNTLCVVVIFHQTFEALGLGTRLSLIPWPQSSRKKYTPYLMAIGYGISTPIAVFIGLGVRHSFAPDSATALVVNGVFDSVSAGILLFTGLVELIAKEFLFNEKLVKEGYTVFWAFLSMVFGAGKNSLSSVF